MCAQGGDMPPPWMRWMATDAVKSLDSESCHSPDRSVVSNATGFSGVRVCVAMLSGWTRCFLAFPPLVAGTSLISRSALLPFTARISLAACVARLSRISRLSRRSWLS